MTKFVALAIALTSGLAVPVVAATNMMGISGGAAPAATGLTVDATGEILYDTNALRIPNGGVLGRGEKSKDDIRYSPALDLGYGRASGRTILAVTGLIGRDIYQRNSYLDRNRFGTTGLLSYSAASCSLSVNGNYSNRQNGIRDFGNALPTLPAPGDPAPDDVGRVIDNRQVAASYGTNATCGSPSGRLSFGGGATHAQLRNGSIARQFANNNSDTYSIFAGIGVFHPGQIQVNGSYSTIGYPNRLATPGILPPPLGLSTGVKTYRGGISLTRPIGTKLTGTIGVSYLTARPTGRQSPYSSPAYDVSLTYIPGTKLSLALIGSRNIIASQTAGALFRVVDQIEFTGNYHVSETIYAHANAGLLSSSYKQTFVTVAQSPRLSESSKIFGAGLSYAPRPLYDVSLFVSHTVRNSNPSTFTYNSTRASLTLAVHI